MGETKQLEASYEDNNACPPLLKQSPKKIKATQTKQPSSPRKPSRNPVGRSFSFCAMKNQLKRTSGLSKSPRPSLGFLAEFRSARGGRGSNRKLSCNVEDPENIVQWLSAGCPEDVVPHILAFAGPQTASALSRVNRHWNAVMKDEETWRVMCEDLYKWQHGEPKPASWKEYYAQNPCVPVDYPCIQSALSQQQPQQQTNHHTSSTTTTKRVFVRPGTYDMPRAVHIQNESSSSSLAYQTVVIEKMSLPEELFSAQAPADPVGALESFQASFHNINTMQLSCPDLLDDSSLSDYGDYDTDEPMRDVVLISQALKRRNEPLFRVSSGSLTIRNIRMQHESMGIDIWGGNAAIQVEPDDDDDDDVDVDDSENNDNTDVTPPPPSVTLQGCEVTSSSGRGIVVLSGGQLETQNCHVHSCAATGIYVGGETSQARLVSTDVTTNGLGNQRTGGIARGHSGIYLEHGKLDVIDSNVSLNAASGISVVAPGERRLTLSSSDLVGNGVMPIDVPFGVEEDDAVFDLLRNSSKLGNRMLPHGSYRTRSSLVQDLPPVISMTDFEEYH